MTRYDAIGGGYQKRRLEDPVLAAALHGALEGAATIVNVGAGTGNYEPPEHNVIAVEPSAVMASQRDPKRPAIRGVAEALPLHDGSVDAAMTVLSLHHWHPNQDRGIHEMARVARRRVVIVTVDPVVFAQMWLVQEYFPEVGAMDREIMTAPTAIARWLNDDGFEVSIESIPTRRDTPDHSLMSFWAHPERVLDADARNATSGFARQPDAVVQRIVSAVQSDLETGSWDERHGHLRELDALDVGMRLIRGQRDT